MVVKCSALIGLELGRTLISLPLVSVVSPVLNFWTALRSIWLGSVNIDSNMRFFLILALSSKSSSDYSVSSLLLSASTKGWGS